MRAARPLALALLGATVLGAAGCGAAGSDSTSDFKGPARAVAVAVEDFQDASRDTDEERICNDLLAASLVRAIEQGRGGGSGSCPDRLHDSLRDASTTDLDVKRVSVTGTRATATVEEQGGHDDRTRTLSLVREGTPARWKIASISR